MEQNNSDETGLPPLKDYHVKRSETEGSKLKMQIRNTARIPSQYMLVTAD
jgi:hypothetical protein